MARNLIVKFFFIALSLIFSIPAQTSDIRSFAADGSFEGQEKVPFEAFMQKFRAELKGFSEPAYTEAQKAQVLATYAHLDPQREIASKLLEKAILYYAWNLPNIRNKQYLTVIDFSKFSGHKRFFIVDVPKGSVWSTRVAHGEGSDKNDDGYAEKFVNIVNSQSTSLGAYLTAETYTSDKNGLSMRLDGLSVTNSKARERAVVYHGATYVKEDSGEKAGMSWGCPAVPMTQRTQILNWIKDGSILFAGTP